MAHRLRGCVINSSPRPHQGPAGLFALRALTNVRRRVLRVTQSGSPPRASRSPSPRGPATAFFCCLSNRQKPTPAGFGLCRARPWLRPCMGSRWAACPAPAPSRFKGCPLPALWALAPARGRPTSPESSAARKRRWGLGPISERPGPARGSSFPEVSVLHGHELGYALSTPGLDW